jgi:amino-acid N-acetyltransferase
MIRKAKIADAKRVQQIINEYAEEKRMLSRSLNYVYENIRDFFVFEDKKI